MDVIHFKADPDPFDGELCIEWQVKGVTSSAIVIHDLQGENIFESPPNASEGPVAVKIKTDFLQDGTYVLSLLLPPPHGRIVKTITKKGE